MESIVIKQSKKLIKLSFQLLEQLIVCYLRKDSCTAKAFVSCFLIKNWNKVNLLEKQNGKIL